MLNGFHEPVQLDPFIRGRALVLYVLGLVLSASVLLVSIQHIR